MPASRRRPSRGVVAGTAVVLVVVIAALGAGVYVRSLPSDLDRFYVPPDGVAAAERGQILREDPFAMPGVAADAARVLYRTEGAGGRPTAASGFVAWPLGEPPEGGFPIVALGHPTESLSDSCAPSRSGFGGISRDEVITFLGAGFAVAGADYPGLGPPEDPHAYLVGDATAASVIDSVRALRARGGDRLSNKVVAWGYSQGGHAVLWARAAAAADAPDLDWRGTVALAPVVDLHELVPADGTDLLGVGVAMGQGARGLDVDSVLTDAGREARDHLASECFFEAAKDTPPGVALLAGDRSWTDALDREVPPVAGAGPALVIYGSADEVVGTAAVAAWVESAQGQDVTGQEVPGAEHSGLVEIVGPEVLVWMRERVNPPR